MFAIIFNSFTGTIIGHVKFSTSMIMDQPHLDVLKWPLFLYWSTAKSGRQSHSSLELVCTACKEYWISLVRAWAMKEQLHRMLSESSGKNSTMFISTAYPDITKNLDLNDVPLLTCSPLSDGISTSSHNGVDHCSQQVVPDPEHMEVSTYLIFKSKVVYHGFLLWFPY